MSACIYCGGDCIDPHDVEEDIDVLKARLLKDAPACPWHQKCEAVDVVIHEGVFCDTYQYGYDCLALSPQYDLNMDTL